MNLPTSKMFYTPKNTDELMEFCERFNGQERAIAVLVAQVTMNMCGYMMEETKGEPNGNDR